MNTTSLISVIVPVYNGARYLAHALDSIVAQTYRPLDIIVVDDGSTDASAEIARAYSEARYVYQAHAGLAAALNQGVEHARGEYFSFLDADDLWVPSKLRRQMDCFARDATLDMVFGQIQYFYGDDLARVSSPTQGQVKGTLLITRRAFYRVGHFDTQWRVGDFIDWYIRAQEKNLKSMILEDVLLKRRIHENNMSTREREHRKAYVQILKQALNRRQK